MKRFPLACLVAVASTSLYVSLAHAAPIYTQIIACRLVSDTTGGELQVRKLELYAEFPGLDQSGAGFLTMSAPNPHLPSMKMEMATAVTMRVEGDKVSLNIMGSDDHPKEVSFSARAMLATMDPKAAPVRITVPGDDGHGSTVYSCEVPMKYPFSMLDDDDRSVGVKAVGDAHEAAEAGTLERKALHVK